MRKKKHFLLLQSLNLPAGPAVGLSLLTSTLSASPMGVYVRATSQVIFSYSKCSFDYSNKSLFCFSTSICYWDPGSFYFSILLYAIYYKHVSPRKISQSSVTLSFHVFQDSFGGSFPQVTAYYFVFPYLHIWISSDLIYSHAHHLRPFPGANFMQTLWTGVSSLFLCMD